MIDSAYVTAQELDTFEVSSDLDSTQEIFVRIIIKGVSDVNNSSLAAIIYVSCEKSMSSGDST